jgi:hypothetical protein
VKSTITAVVRRRGEMVVLKLKFESDENQKLFDKAMEDGKLWSVVRLEGNKLEIVLYDNEGDLRSHTTTT